MHDDLVVTWRNDIVGEWQTELTGVDLLYLEAIQSEFAFRLVLRQDGSADLGSLNPPPPSRPVPPFPTTWDLSDKRVLSIWEPIAPMPEYEMPDWSREQTCFDVLSVAELSLALSNRRFDNESIYVLRRVDQKEFWRRKAAEHGLPPTIIK